MIENPLIDEILETNEQAEKEDTVVVEKEKKSRAKESRTLYPETWAGHFGCAAGDIRTSYLLWRMGCIAPS